MIKASRPFDIKSSALPVLRVVVRDCDPDSLDGEMSAAFANAQPLLGEALAVLDLRERDGDDVTASRIIGVARDAGVQLAAVLVGDRAEQIKLADTGLPILQVPLVNGERPATVTEEAPEAAPEQEVPKVPPTPLYVTEPLRSGRRLYAQGRDLVVLAPTSRGCELIADGSIYAFSLLRGRVVAGAGGDKEARIIATQLDAELVAIAGAYRTLEAPDLADLGNGAVSVTLVSEHDGGERLVLRAVDRMWR
jgi:septum site-determining protein MinC